MLLFTWYDFKGCNSLLMLNRRKLIRESVNRNDVPLSWKYANVFQSDGAGYEQHFHRRYTSSALCQIRERGCKSKPLSHPYFLVCNYRTVLLLNIFRYVYKQQFQN